MSWHADDPHLFRLASTFRWDDAVSLCDELCSGIQRAASADVIAPSASLLWNDSLPSSFREREDRSLAEWLEHANGQLFYRDQWGNTPLHAASYVQPPLHAVEALFRAGREIRKHDKTDGARLPLWAMPSKDDSTPFLVACSTGATVSVLQCYLDEVEYYIEQNWVDPSYARMLVLRPDNLGATPLMGWISFHRGWIAHLELASSDASPHICAATRDDTGRLPLHNAIQAIEIHSTLLKFTDERNGTYDSSSTFIGRPSNNLDINRNEVIEALLRWYPKAAGEPFPNGRSPLCEAIARGGYWHSIEDPRTDLDASGLIEMLCKYAPDKSLERDTVTRLFPFMLAATIVPSLDNKQTEALDTIYHLLRNDPQPVQFASRRSSTGV
ncbi:hypothetical protein ACHAW6_000830 [Cyclotella cf. meneghiniana]